MELKSPKELGFKYDSFRPQQEKAIKAILDAIDREKRYIIAELPTGSGKSLIAMTVHKLVSEKTYVVVSTKTLQNQYMREFNIPTVKGRNNFRCLRKPKLTVDKAICNIRKCSRMSQCPYFVQRNVAIESDVSIHNYTYFLTVMNYTRLFREADLIVFDEAHTMDMHLASFVNIRISKDIMPFIGNNVIESLKDAKTEVDIQIDELRRELEGLDEESKLFKLYVDMLNEYLTQSRKLETLIEKFDSTNFIIEETSKSYVFRPVWTSEFSDMYFSHGEVFLMMSATIGNPGVFMRLLGIPDDEAVFIRGGSVFSVKNRPVKVISGPSINYRNVDNLLPEIVRKVDIIISNEKGKGIIHVPSYDFGKAIYNMSKYKDRMLMHSSADDRDAVIDEFMISDNKILISPSVHTGLDFKDDLARWQIITKVPYADLSDKVIRRRFEDNRMWYTQDAILKVVQAYGRIVRSFDDWGTTYILDGNINFLVKKYTRMFPSWFLDAFKFCWIQGDKIVCSGGE